MAKLSAHGATLHQMAKEFPPDSHGVVFHKVYAIMQDGAVLKKSFSVWPDGKKYGGLWTIAKIKPEITDLKAHLEANGYKEEESIRHYIQPKFRGGI